MKLNLGCGNDKREGWLNVDASSHCEPDRVVDLERTPWPFEDSSAEEVLMSHVLEHLGQTPKDYLSIIKELYRIGAPDALVTVLIPHPRHDDFLLDPTHVRPLLPESFLLFSKAMCEKLQAEGGGDTPLALILGVDFELVKIDHRLDPLWRERLTRGEISQEDLEEAVRSQNNVIKETKVTLRVMKT